MESNWTTASVKNIRAQRQLELEYKDLDRLRHLHLKNINHQRLGVIYDLNRYRTLRRTAEYTSSTISGVQLRHYTRKCQNIMLEQRVSQRRARKFDFAADAIDKINLRLPPINVEIDPEKENGLFEEVTSSELNRKRAYFKKGANELEQYLMRTVPRKEREKRAQDMDDETDVNEKAQDGESSEGHHLQKDSSIVKALALPKIFPYPSPAASGNSLMVPTSNVSLSIRSIVSPRFLPSIQEVLLL